MATFGAGCFWGVEAAFRRIDGVVETQVGYAGGRTENPSYQQVCYEGTGHAEVVQVTYDPTKVVYEQLLAVGQGRVIPGDPACSEMIVRTNSPGEDYQMPPGDALTAPAQPNSTNKHLNIYML